jgi:hypothetical protein
VNLAITIFASLASGLLLVFVVHDLMVFIYKAGYERGRNDADKAWMELGREVDHARQQIWKEQQP